jgi:cell division protein FtsZ
MGCAQAEGENRALEAVKAALSSPLLNDNDIEGASDVLLYITSGQEEISMDEVTEITDYIQQEAKSQAEIIWGNGYDDSLGKNISITLIATGFDAHKRAAQENIIRHTLNGETHAPALEKPLPAVSEVPPVEYPIEMIRKPAEEINLQEVAVESALTEVGQVEETEEEMLIDEVQEAVNTEIEEQPIAIDWKEDDRNYIFEFSQQEDIILQEETVEVEKEEISAEYQAIVSKIGGEPYPGNEMKKPEEIKPFELYIKKPGGDTLHETEKTFTRPSVDLKSQERIERLRNLSMKLKSESAIEELENEPAYIRRNVELKNIAPSSESRVSKYSLYEDSETKNLEIRSGNSYLHDNVD